MTIITVLVNGDRKKVLDEDPGFRAMKQGYKTAAAAVLEITLLGNLMDMMKVEKQRNHSSSYPQILRQFSGKGFIRANMHGLLPWGVAMYGTRGLVYGGGYGAFSHFLAGRSLNEDTKKTVASIGAGLLEGAATTPMSLMRTRTAEAVMGGQKAKFDMRALARSLPLSSLKRGGDWGIRSVIYHKLNKEHSHAVSAFSAGVVSSLITIPIDRFIPLLQQNNPPKYPFKWMMQSIREQGPRTLFAGTTMRLLHAGWHTLFIFGALHLLDSNKLVKY